MSAQAMLSFVTDLNIQPGEIPPTLHLKKNSNSMHILLRIAADDTIMETDGTAILKATRPDASEIFIVIPVAEIDTGFISVELNFEQIEELTSVAGTFEGTISIIDSENAISQADYENYDLITVQPFILDVQKSAVE